MRLVLLAILYIALASAVLSALAYGVNKQLDINENTRYDKETGRMVYHKEV